MIGTHAPAEVTTATPDAAGLARALGTGAEWIWLLADGARPADDALARLWATVAPAGERPATLAAGMVHDAAGRPVESALGSGARGDLPALLRLAERRLLPLASTPAAHCLVARHAFDRLGRPDFDRFGLHAWRVWSRALLVVERGYLDPASVVVLAGAPARRGRADVLRTLAATARAAGTGVWTRGEATEALADALRR